MAFNIAFSCVIGLIPVAGDIVDSFLKFNTRNVKILESLLKERREKAIEEARAAQSEAGEKLSQV
jgi:hypothetical protein